MSKPTTVDEYVATLDGWRQAKTEQVVALVRAAAPDAEEAIKWAQPVWSSGGPFAYLKAFKNSVNFGFWRGASLPDATSILQGDGDKMRHIKLTESTDVAELTPDIEALIAHALKLNADEGDPTKRR